MSELLRDASKKVSSKRVAAFVGIGVMTLLSGIAVFKDPAQAANILWPWAIMVGALLGVTVLEKK